MKLSRDDHKDINEFFNDKALSETFVELYNYQLSLCDDIMFINRKTIIGFGRQNEHMRCYVTRAKNGFLIKIKMCNEALDFNEEDIAEYKELIFKNSIVFIIKAEQYKIKEKEEQSKSSKKTSRNSNEKKDIVLSKLKNRNKARKFTLQEFNDLADWTYCPSFNDDGYIYTLPNGNRIECDSKSEVTFLDYLTSKKIALAIGGQNLLIKYDSAFRNDLDYYPDIVILTKDYHIAIIEIKPATAMSNHKNIEKHKALKEYCEEHGYEYMMVDPDRDYMTFDDMMKLRIPNAIKQRVDAYLVNLIGEKGECLLEKDDIPILYEDFEDEYKKGEFILYLHALVIQNDWYNRFINGFMVYEKPCYD